MPMVPRRCVLEKVILLCLAFGISLSITGCGGTPGGGGGGDTTVTTTAPEAITTNTTTTTSSTSTKEQCSDDKAQCTECKDGACLKCKDPYVLETGKCFAKCSSSSFEKPARPTSPFDHNGIAWPTMCIEKTEAHFFGIGDWGGDMQGGHTWTNPSKCDAESNPYRPCLDKDSWAQAHVASQMAVRAVDSNPDYVLNAGDNFYPGGYTNKDAQGKLIKTCGIEATSTDSSGQWDWGFEQVYKGQGLDGKPWFGVLGNHDYGGIHMEAGWDRQVFHTWDADRWLLPAQYWSRRVQYKDFAVEYYFLESNVFDAHHFTDPITDRWHNICQGTEGGEGTGCWKMTPQNCRDKLMAAYTASVEMAKEGIAKSTAEWHILVTHFPPPQIIANADIVKLHNESGIDLLFTGHSHMQVHGVDQGIPWVISGGGGGATTDVGPPTEAGEDDAYGFVDFTITRTSLKFEMISHTGVVRKVVTLESHKHKKTALSSTATDVVM